MRAAVVTGVSRGLGEAMAAALLAHGFRVLGVGRRDSPRLAHAAYRFAEVDLGDIDRVTDACAAALGALAEEHPEYAVLINNAAIVGPFGRVGHPPEDALARSLAVNLVAPVMLASLFCRVFPAGERRIINVSSGSAARALPGGGMYSVAKAGLEMLTTALATDHRDAGFRAVSVRPGIIDTGMQTDARSQDPETFPAVALFQGFHKGGQLVPAAITAQVIVDKLVLGPVENGRTYTYQELSETAAS